MRNLFLGVFVVIVLTGLVAVLAACQTQQVIKEPVPPIRDITAGSSLVLLKPLVLSRGASAAVFQNGRIVETHAIRNDMPVCRLELDAARGSDITVDPQQIPVKSIAYDEQRLGIPSELTTVTKVVLGKTKTNPFETMRCQWPVPSPGANFVSSEDIAATLGDYFSIEEPG